MVEAGYDAWDRPIVQSTLLSGTVSPSSIRNTGSIFPAGASVRVERRSYDSRGRLVGEQDGAGYTTSYTVDNAGNVAATIRQVWQGHERESAVVHAGFNQVRENVGHDSLGRVLQRTNGRGYTERTAYDPMGNILGVQDGRGVVVRQYEYTPDGLVQRIFEPDVTSSSAHNSFHDRTGFMLMEEHVYPLGQQAAGIGDGRSPVQSWRATMNTPGTAGVGAGTSYVYDSANRITEIRFPDLTSLQKRYDLRGNSTYERNRQGFVTTFVYNWQSKMTLKSEEPRSNDKVAGFENVLESRYEYNPMGDVVFSNERGIVTHRRYNSIGAAILESMPSTVSGALWKVTLYQLDGLPNAITNYSYAGAIGNGVSDISHFADGRIAPSVGNVTARTYDARGLPLYERSWGAGPVEYEKAMYHDGLGNMYARMFAGSTDIYVGQYGVNNQFLGHGHGWTYWVRDQASNLKSYWETPSAGNGVEPSDRSLRRNQYRYEYDASGNITYEVRDTRVQHASFVIGNNLYNNLGGSTGVLLAASVGSVSYVYNSRGMLSSIEIINNMPDTSSLSPFRQDQLGNAVHVHQTYQYYRDGKLMRATEQVNSGALKEVVNSYDAMGRSAEQRDSHVAERLVNRVIKRNYGQDGTTIVEVLQGNQVVYREETIPTMDGMIRSKRRTGVVDSIGTYYSYRTAVVENTYGNAGSLTGRLLRSKSSTESPYEQLPYTVQRFTYDSYGRIRQEDELSFMPNGEPIDHNTKTYNFNSEGHVVSEGDNNGIREYRLDSRGNRLAVIRGQSAGFQKRYDAEGRVASYSGSGGGGFGINGRNYEGQGRRHNDFLYSPYGMMTLSSTADINENRVDSNEFTVQRDMVANFGTAEQMEVQIRKAGQAAYFRNHPLSSYSPRNTYHSNPISVKGSNYTISDAFGELPGSRSVFAPEQPFSLPDPIEPELAVASASSVGTSNSVALSEQLRVSPNALAPQALPSLPDASQLRPANGESEQNSAPAASATPTSSNNASQQSSSSAASSQAGALAKAQSEAASPSVEGERSLVSEIYDNLYEPSSTMGGSTSFTGNGVYCTGRTPNGVPDYEAERNCLVGSTTSSDRVAQIEAWYAERILETTVRDRFGAASAMDVRVIAAALKDAGMPPGYRVFQLNMLLDGLTNQTITAQDLRLYAQYARTPGSAGQPRIVAQMTPVARILAHSAIKMYGTEALASVASLHPVLGSLISVYELVSGRSVSGAKLDAAARVLAGVSVALPFLVQARQAKAAAGIAQQLQRHLDTSDIARRARAATAARFACGNSFSGDTPVRTIAGLVTISTLTLGTPVLAYNEATGEQGYYPVTDVISYGVQDQPITYLSIRSQDGSDEVIKATPNHPFYLVDSVDGGERPQPEGYNLGANWVGAGDLKIGDTVRRADGSTGTVVQTATVGETRQVYNLTVNTAHTYFVGEREWLVHNTVCSPILTRFGYTGSRQYRSVVDTVRTNSNTITEIIVGRDSLGRTISAIPNRQEAERLIAEAGGRVLRVERAHPAPGHTYPHINYTIDGKHVVTIRVEGVGREYQGPGQNNYRGNPRR